MPDYRFERCDGRHEKVDWLRIFAEKRELAAVMPQHKVDS
jgi:hypothetical protein